MKEIIEEKVYKIFTVDLLKEFQNKKIKILLPSTQSISLEFL